MTSSVAIATKQVDADEASELDLIRYDCAADIERKVLPTPRICLLNECSERDLTPSTVTNSGQSSILRLGSVRGSGVSQ